MHWMPIQGTTLGWLPLAASAGSPDWSFPLHWVLLAAVLLLDGLALASLAWQPAANRQVSRSSWALMILLAPLVGATLYFVASRRNGGDPNAWGPHAGRDGPHPL